ncbi:hypothetical protein RUM44_006066 [Polyplax serrata]|uniref:Ig-like domain-containing protein n=1 Tax=Polyplax serrata TaxID=468196 RepID=A0ABR1AYW4_POLSC
MKQDKVSWVRHRDIHLLTVGRYTYTSDQRFRAIHHVHSEEWTLQIKYPQHRDSGIYECQISTTPHLSHFIHFTVVEEMRKIMKLRRHGKSSALGFAGFKLKRLAVGSACNSI